MLEEGARILQVPPLTVAKKKHLAYLVPELFALLDSMVLI